MDVVGWWQCGTFRALRCFMCVMMRVWSYPWGVQGCRPWIFLQVWPQGLPVHASSATPTETQARSRMHLLALPCRRPLHSLGPLSRRLIPRLIGADRPTDPAGTGSREVRAGPGAPLATCCAQLLSA